MKKKLSLLLVLALIVSLVPMSAFATSDNSVTKTVKAKDDVKFKNADNAPMLKIENDKGDMKNETFKISLENAEWLKDKDGLTVTSDVYSKAPGADDPNKEADYLEAIMKAVAENKADKDAASGTRTVDVKRITDTELEVTISGAQKDDVFKFPLLVELQGKGDAKATIKSMDSNVGGGTYTFAVGASGDTTTTISSVESFADNTEIKTIQIDETAVDAMGTGSNSRVKLKLPTNFTWLATNAKVKLSGGLVGAKVIAADGDEVTAGKEYTLKTGKFDDRTLEFHIDLTNIVGGTRGSIYIEGLKIDAEKDAKNGDVVMTISGDDVSTEDVVIAKYVDYDVTVKATEEPKELVAGKYEGFTWGKEFKDGKVETDEQTIGDKENVESKASSYPDFYATTDDDAHKLAKLKIEEEVENSWLTTRKTRVEFPSWVKVVKVNVKDNSDVKDAAGGTSKAAIETELMKQLKIGDNYIEFKLEKDGTNPEAMVELQFYVSVEAGREGDIVAKVGGNALDKEREIVLGKVIKAVKTEVKPADIRTGIKNQPLDKIVIKEGKAEAFKKDGNFILELEDGVQWTEVPTIKVTEGNLDLDIDAAKVKNEVLTIPVKSDSSKASTIEITDAKVDLTRSVAEGDIELSLKGSALVRNYVEKGKDRLALFNEDEADKVVVARVITPADKNTKAGEAVKFVIGNAEYQVGEAVKTADVAPYIKDGRTMLSVRYVAEAMGVPEASIVWNDAARTVTVFKGERVAQVTIGSPQLMVNGTPVMMDTVAEIKDGRTMLPISFIAKALGAEANWDAATQTVTIK